MTGPIPNNPGNAVNLDTPNDAQLYAAFG
jgi:hypothetical protein